MKRICLGLLTLALGVAVLWPMVGCETASDERGLVHIQVDDPIVDLTGVGAIAVLSLTRTDEDTSTTNTPTLLLPLEWSVSERSLGAIISASDFQAVYESTGAVGKNIVTVRDQSGRSGLWVIDQM